MSSSSSDDDDQDEDDDDDDNDRRVATGLIARDATLERAAVLVLEFAKDPTPSFAATQVTHQRIHRPCDDWTPEKIGSRASRHYIVGDESESMNLPPSSPQRSRTSTFLRRRRPFKKTGTPLSHRHRRSTFRESY